jgi:hypothetical protein
MLDVSVSYNRFRFMGNEFLTWLWFLMERDPDGLRNIITPDLTLSLGNRTVLENRSDAGVEIISIKGDDAGLEEARLALKKGAMVSELNLRCESGEKRWTFTLKGESMAITHLKMPETAPVQFGEDIEGSVIEKVYLLEIVLSLLDNLFGRFIKLRVSNRWQEKVVPAMKKWIVSGAAVPTA